MSEAQVSTERPRWWRLQPRLPLAEEDRQKQARAFIERSSYRLAIFLPIFGIGLFFHLLSTWQIWLLCGCGIIDTKFHLRDLRSADRTWHLLAGGNFTLWAAILCVDSSTNERSPLQSILTSMGAMIYAVSCGAMSNALLCCLFQEPFLRYVEQPQETLTSRPAPVQKFDSQETVIPVPAAVQKFDY